MRDSEKSAFSNLARWMDNPARETLPSDEDLSICRLCLEKNLFVFPIFNVAFSGEKTELNDHDREMLNKKYREIALILHPDKNRNITDEQKNFFSVLSNIRNQLLEGNVPAVLNDQTKEMFDSEKKQFILNKKTLVGFNYVEGSLNVKVSCRGKNISLDIFASQERLKCLYREGKNSEREYESLFQTLQTDINDCLFLYRMAEMMVNFYRINFFGKTIAIQIKSIDISFFDFAYYPTFRFYFDEHVRTFQTKLSYDQLYYLLDSIDGSFNNAQAEGLILCFSKSISDQVFFDKFYQAGVKKFSGDIQLQSLNLTEVTPDDLLCFLQQNIRLNNVILSVLQLTYLHRHHFVLDIKKHQFSIESTAEKISWQVYAELLQRGYYPVMRLNFWSSCRGLQQAVCFFGGDITGYSNEFFTGISIVKKVSSIKLTESQLVMFIKNGVCCFENVSLSNIRLSSLIKAVHDKRKKIVFSDDFMETDNAVCFLSIDFSECIVDLNSLYFLAEKHVDFLNNFNPSSFYFSHDGSQDFEEVNTITILNKIIAEIKSRSDLFLNEQSSPGKKLLLALLHAKEKKLNLSEIVASLFAAHAEMDCR